KRIRDSEQHFRTIAESHPVPVAIVEPDGGRVLHASRAFADLLGISLDQANGIDIKQFYVNLKDRGHLIRTLRDRGGIQTFEHQVRRADGTIFPVSVTSRLIEHQGREAIVSGVLDLTEQKRAEAEIARQREALRVSEQRFKTIAEAHPVPVGIVRRSDRKVLYASPAFVELLGTSLEELYARDPRDFYADPEERLKISEALRQNRVVVNMEFAARRHDGTTFPAAMTCKVIDYEGEEAVVAGVVDLTELQRVEQQLRESEQRFKVFAEAHPVPVIIVTLHDAKVIYASRPCQDLLGTEELLGRSILPFYANSDDRAPFVERVHQEDGVNGFEVRLRRADGSEFWAAFTSRLITFEGRDAMVTAIVDLTEPKRAEAEIARQQEALHQSEKMNALGSLLANVAHELNNPLSVVVGYATMMRDLTTD
ncbi:MAG: PAS domain S-box protein, partial [Nitrospirota bacterium]|nr:PAS domain S-box protein [Nitrospirota bacterium]